MIRNSSILSRIGLSKDVRKCLEHDESEFSSSKVIKFLIDQLLKLRKLVKVDLVSEVPKFLSSKVF